MKRLFFALDLKTDDKQAIALWRDKHPITAKPVQPENFHITLAFLGQVTSDIEKALINHLSQINKPKIATEFVLKITKLAHFKKPQVLYLGFDHFPDELKSLAKALRQLAIAHDIKQESRHYLPHITIFRKVKTLPQFNLPAQLINVSSFSLYHSESTEAGVQYHPLVSWPICKL